MLRRTRQPPRCRPLCAATRRGRRSTTTRAIRRQPRLWTESSGGCERSSQRRRCHHRLPSSPRVAPTTLTPLLTGEGRRYHRERRRQSGAEAEQRARNGGVLLPEDGQRHHRAVHAVRRAAKQAGQWADGVHQGRGVSGLPNKAWGRPPALHLCSWPCAAPGDPAILNGA